MTHDALPAARAALPGGHLSRAPDPLELLRRRDRHRLAAGDGILFDPAEPRWLDRPGFWDGGSVFQHHLAPLFTLTFVEDSGRERPLRCVHREWSPAELVTSYVGGGLELEERRCVVAGGRFLSEWRVTNGVAEPVELSVVAWTAQEGGRLGSRRGLTARGDGIVFLSAARGPGGDRELRCTLRFDQEADAGWGAYESEAEPGQPLLPDWAATPFPDRWHRAGLRNERRLATARADGEDRVVWLGLSRRIRLGAGETDSFGVGLQLLPGDPAWRPRSAETVAPPPGRGAAASRTSWQQYFAGAPALVTSDPFLERFFPWRWYTLRLAALDATDRLPWPTIAEGTGERHRPGAATAWAQVRELRWLADPARARGTLRAFLAHLDASGHFPARFVDGLPEGRAEPDGAWGDAVLALDEVHPDPAFLEWCYGPLCRYAAMVDAEGDAEGIGLVSRPARGGEAARKDVARTVGQYRLRRALARLAATLGRRPELLAHDAAADLIAEAVRQRMWDPGTAMFFDLDLATLRPDGVRRAASFHPYLCDLAGGEHLPGLTQHLLDPAEFWTPFPVPSVAASEPGYQPDGFEGGVRRLEPAAGRVEPLANCHIAEVLGHAATALDPAWRFRAGEFLQRFLRMMCRDGDPARPAGFAHCSPETGRAAAPRGFDDAPAGWFNDLLIRYVAGVRPAGPDLVVDPFPTGVDRLRLERLPWRGRRVGVVIAGGMVRVSVDGAPAVEGPLGAALTLSPAGSPARTPS